jgi:tRNA G37 N-methylase Trm5
MWVAQASGETVVDLFCGIGYFTIPLLAKSGADKVYACEWNPDSVEALRRNLEANDVSHKCEILHGDNRCSLLVKNTASIWSCSFVAKGHLCIVPTVIHSYIVPLVDCTPLFCALGKHEGGNLSCFCFPFYNSFDPHALSLAFYRETTSRLHSTADRVLLGLLPSSEYSWPIAIAVITTHTQNPSAYACPCCSQFHYHAWPKSCVTCLGASACV